MLHAHYFEQGCMCCVLVCANTHVCTYIHAFVYNHVFTHVVIEALHDYFLIVNYSYTVSTHLQWRQWSGQWHWAWPLQKCYQYASHTVRYLPPVAPCSTLRGEPTLWYPYIVCCGRFIKESTLPTFCSTPIPLHCTLCREFVLLMHIIMCFSKPENIWNEHVSQ